MRPRTIEGSRPVKSPARRIAPHVTGSRRAMENPSNPTTPARNAIPVSAKKRKRFSGAGTRIAPTPPARIVDPISPPINAWLLDVGRPHHHVTRSHTIAPTTPARMIVIAWRNCAPRKTEVSTIPFPIVSAIAFVMKTMPTKFPTAAIATAFVGVRTFVATIVAIAFAASWNPLKKSNARTRRMAGITISRTTSRPPESSAPGVDSERGPPPLGEERAHRFPSLVFRNDVAQHVRHVLTVVRGFFQPLDDLLGLYDVDNVLLVEQRRHGVVHQVVSDVLETVHLDGDPLHLVPLAHVPDHPDRPFELACRQPDDLCKLHHRRTRALDLIKEESIRRRVNHVQDV